MLKQFLLDNKFTNKDAEIVLSKLRNLEQNRSENHIKPETTISFLLRDFSPKEIKRMIIECNEVLIISLEDYKRRISDLKKLKYTDKMIKTILTENSKVLFMPLEHVKAIRKFLLLYGFNKAQVLSITARNSKIFNYSIYELRDKIAKLEEIGFNREQIIRLINYSPKILKSTSKKILHRVSILLELGFTHAEALHILSYAKAIEKTEELVVDKLIFYLKKGLKRAVINDPHNAFIQGEEITKARLHYFAQNNITDNSIITRKIFISSRDFFKTFLRTNEELLVIYRVQNDLEEKRQTLLPES